MEADLEPPAERLPARRRDDGLGREPEPHQELLQRLYALSDLVQLSVLDGLRHLREVRPHAEVAALAADDEPDDVVPFEGF